MKQIILIVISTLPFISKGQIRILPDTSRIAISHNFLAKPGTYYLDSVEIDPTKVYLDPENIKDIKVLKGEDSKLFSGSQGVIVITRKTNRKLSTLGDIARKFPADSLKQFKFIIDDKIVTDTSKVRLEATVIKQIKVLRNTDGKVDHGFSQSVDILLTTSLKKKG